MFIGNDVDKTDGRIELSVGFTAEGATAAATAASYC